MEHVQAIDRQQARETLEFAQLLNGTGYFLYERGRYGETEPLYVKALRIYRSQLGEDHPHTAASLNNLAALYNAQGRYGEAEPLLRQALEIVQSQLGDNHPHTAASLSGLALLLYVQGRYGEAELFFLQALVICMQTLGENHPNTQTVWQNFVYFLQQVMAAGRTADLSDHPLTQGLLAQLQQG